jgi:hypothetical protein
MTQRSFTKMLAGSLLAAALACAIFPTSAAVPYTINYQGFLTNPSTGARRRSSWHRITAIRERRRFGATIG